jgi:hypothetical protein
MMKGHLLSPMRSRRCLFLFIAVASLLALGMWLTWPHTRITRENAVRIHEGMTLEEVELLLGGPGRDETSGPTTEDDKAQHLPEITDEKLMRKMRLELAERRGKFNYDYSHASAERRWRSDEVGIVVLLDPAGRVTSCSWLPLCRRPETFLQRLRRFLDPYL